MNFPHNRRLASLVVDDSGAEFKVEVDAATGRIIEVAVERWEIGEEGDERN